MADEVFDPESLDRLLEPAGDDLDEARRFLRLLLDEAPVASLVAHVEPDPSPHFRLDYLSPNGEALFGEPAERVVATFDTWIDRLAPDDRTELARQYLQLVTGEVDAMVAEFELVADGGSLNLAMRYDAEREWLYGHLFDVSGRQVAHDALVDNRQLLSAIMRASPDVFVVAGSDWITSYVSPVVREMLGYEPYELVGRSTFDLVHPDDRQAMLAELADREGDELPGVIRTRLRHKDGGWVTTDMRTRTLVDADGQRRTLGISRDATPQLLQEQRLREARDAAELASRAKDEFLSRMSHELRTPLNAVLGFAQLLELGELDTDERESVEQIRRAGVHLLQLIDEVLDIARIEAGKINVSLEPVELGEVVTGALDLVRPMASLREVELRVRGVRESWVLADRQRLGQVVHNLLSNAVAFSREGGRVEVAAARADDGTWNVLVSDTGPGLDDEVLGRIFEPFERLDDEQQRPGSGIGLALSSALTRQMGGTLTATSTIGQGTTFAVRLPVATPATASRSADPSAWTAGAGPPLRILCIDDNTTNRELIAQALRWRGGDTLVSAEQGLLGVALAMTDPPDVVLLDLHLLDIDGIEVLQRLRAAGPTAHIPVIVLSADATTYQRERSLEHGADHFVTKPIDLPALLGLLDRYRDRVQER